MNDFLFGRGPRSYDPRVPHLSALLAKSGVVGKAPAPPPEAVDYTYGMPDNFGEMLNLNLNDCTCAAYYHARQVWTYKILGHEITEPDSDVKQMYIEACGYNPTPRHPGRQLNAKLFSIIF